MHPKDAAGIANSVDPDQTAPLGAVWSGSALFAQTYLSDYGKGIVQCGRVMLQMLDEWATCMLKVASYDFASDIANLYEPQECRQLYLSHAIWH